MSIEPPLAGGPTIGPMSTPAGSVEDDGDAKFEALLEEHRRRWEQGEPISAAEFLASQPILQSDSYKAATLIYQEFVLREERGDDACFDKYLAEFPQYAADLRLLGDADQLLTRLLADPAGPATVGCFLGDFELLNEIGRGGMGVVYRARQKGIERLVALKTLSADRLASAVDVERFRNEARAVGRLSHPNIVAIHTAGLRDGRHFFTMDLVEGQSLADRVRDGPLPPLRAAGYVRDVALAIHYAHEQGILHRDLKPSNILIDLNDQPRITDFGLAHRLTANSQLTLTGQVLGTPGYMAPEQASGRRGDLSAASDVYALGAILYELLTGRPTLLADTPMEALLQLMQMEPVSPRLLNARVPRDLETICLKCLEKEPGRRYASAAELAGDLGRFVEGAQVPARPIGRTGRLARWARRNPVVAGLAAGAAASLVIGICGSTYFAIQANQRADEAVRARLDSDYRLYVSDMRLAQRAWDDNQVPRVLELLNAHTPKGVADNDHRGFEWYYLDNLCHSALLTLKGAGDANFGITYSSDGRLLAACGRDGVRVWDSATGRVLHNLRGRGRVTACVAFSPDGKRVASGAETSLDVWNVADGEFLLTIPDAGPVVGVAYSADGRTLAAVGTSGNVVLCDAATGKTNRTLPMDFGALSAVAYSPDGKRLAAASRNGAVAVWDLKSNSRTMTWRGYTESSNALAFSPDGGRIVFSCENTNIRICDVESGEVIRTIQGHTAHVGSLGFSRDGVLVSAGNDQTVRVWDATSGRQIRIFRGHTGNVQSVAFRPDGKHVASASSDDTLRIWDVTRRGDATALEGHSKEVNDVAFSADGRRLATASHDGTIGLWDVERGAKTTTLHGRKGPVFAACFSPDGRLLATAGEDGDVSIWDAYDGRRTLTLKGHTSTVWAATFSPSGDRLATAGNDGALRIWDMAHGVELFQCKGHVGHVSGVVFRPDGLQLASAAWDNTVRIWNAADGRDVQTLQSNGSPNWRVAYSPDGKRLASVGNDYVVRIWDLNRGQVLHMLRGHTAEVSGVSFSRKGDRIASAGWDGTVRVWDADRGEELLTLKGQTSRVFAVAFSPNGDRIASTTREGEVQIWDATPRGN